VSITTSKPSPTKWESGYLIRIRNLNPEELSVPAEELIVRGSYSFKDGVEALWCNLSTELLEFVDQHHHQITDKSCVVSALMTT